MTANHLRLVVPSFNRACQLECLLRSLFDTCQDHHLFSVTVFYRHTDDDFAAGYDIVKKAYANVTFVQQSLTSSFKQQILNLTDESEFFGIIVDDMVVLEPFSPRDRQFELLLERADIFSLSLRLDAAKVFSQPVNMAAASPTFDKDLVWQWKPRLTRNYRLNRLIEKHINKSAFFDWEVPCALDGSIFRTALFRRFFETVEEFANIPFIEQSMWNALRRFRNAPKNMIRYPKTRSLSIAMNSVDEYHDFPSLGLNPRDFNARFLAGSRLDYLPFKKIVFHACHVVSEPFWLI